MSSNLKDPRSPNYAATVVALDKFVDLSNCDNIKAALIFGNHVIVSKDAQPGEIGLFFPVETALSGEFLTNNNLYRKPELNTDSTAKGFFEEHGRVKCVKFRGHKSEGFFIPTESLLYVDGMFGLNIGDTFDFIGEHEICRKYVPKRRAGNTSTPGLRGRGPSLEEQIVAGQFRFHFDTENLRRNIHNIQPDDYISISDKWHGTSAVIGRVLVNRPLKWFERLLLKLGVNIRTDVYGLVYSSRRVIKAVGGAERSTRPHDTRLSPGDIWGVVAKEVEPSLPNGFTVYGEIVGFDGAGRPIQPGYGYGCEVGQHRFLVYRVTFSNAAGTLELSWKQMLEFCNVQGLDHVRELFYGQAKDLVFEDIGDPSLWHEYLLKLLEANWVHDQMCPHNDSKVPAEGVVVRIDRLRECESFKLKNFRFLEWETKQLDKGTVDIETEESQAGDELEEAA